MKQRGNDFAVTCRRLATPPDPDRITCPPAMTSDAGPLATSSWAFTPTHSAASHSAIEGGFGAGASERRPRRRHFCRPAPALLQPASYCPIGRPRVAAIVVAAVAKQCPAKPVPTYVPSPLDDGPETAALVDVWSASGDKSRISGRRFLHTARGDENKHPKTSPCGTVYN